MIMLVFLACLKHGGECEVVAMPLQMNQLQCDYKAQENVANWLSQHPDYELGGRWVCMAGERAA